MRGLEDLISSQNGVLTRAQVVDRLGRKKLEWLVRDGQWRIPVPGVVLAHNGPETPVQRQWIAVLGCGPNAVLAGVSAAVAGGLRRRAGSVIHVLVAGGRGSERRGGWYPEKVRVHRTSTLPDKDLLLARRPPRTAMPRSLVDAAQWAMSDDEARAIVAAGCQQGLARPDDVLATVERMPRARRRALVIDTARLATIGVTSLPEIDFHRLCRRFRLPPPDHQKLRHDHDGRPRYLDAYWALYRLHVEVDGRWHMEPASWWKDMSRQNALWIAGDRVLRFPAWLIRECPAEVAGQLREALRAGGWRP